MQAQELEEREARPAIVRFELRAIEDKAASLEQKRYVAKDVEFALITPPYSKDVHIQKVKSWLDQMENDVRNRRIPAKWQAVYLEQLKAWRAGQEMPLNGEPIRGWPVISPAQMEMLLRINILTVEDLAGINDEGARAIGMGAIELRNKAKAWLAQRGDKAPLVIEIAAIKTENANLKATLDTALAQIAAMKSRLDQVQPQDYGTPAPAPQHEISLDDIVVDGSDDDSDTPE